MSARPGVVYLACCSCEKLKASGGLGLKGKKVGFNGCSSRDFVAKICQLQQRLQTKPSLLRLCWPELAYQARQRLAFLQIRSGQLSSHPGRT